DPASAAGVSPNNLVHVGRALEICLATGQPASALRQAHGFKNEALAMRVVAIDRSDELLRTRIAARTNAMLEAGLSQEVQGMLDAGVSSDCRAMDSVGYREALACLRGEIATGDLAEVICRRTWQYVRRQRIWLRKEKDRTWIKEDDDQELLRRLEMAVGLPLAVTHPTVKPSA